nr:MAG TPA: hypothetical protein [Caudoviricetes sp.]
MSVCVYTGDVSCVGAETGGVGPAGGDGALNRLHFPL